MAYPYQYPGGLGPFKLFPVNLPPTEHDIVHSENGMTVSLTFFSAPASEYATFVAFYEELDEDEVFVFRMPVLPTSSYNSTEFEAGNFYLTSDVVDPQCVEYKSGPSDNAVVYPAQRAEGPTVLRNYQTCQPLMRCTLSSGPTITTEGDLLTYSMVIQEAITKED